MPQFASSDASLYYEAHGHGPPVLLFAPGGMNSAVQMWANATINPLQLFADDFRLIAMDQRNTGQSSGPLDIDDPWGAYARDQLELLDHLDVDRFQIIGCCIGGSFALKLIEQAPERVLAAVLQQPIGIAEGNRQLYGQMWRTWGTRLAAERSDIDPQAVEKFGTRMWEHDFVVSVTRDFVRSCTAPLLVLPGTDRYHPTATGREIAAVAPNAQIIEPWNDSPAHVVQAARAIDQFLKANSD
jgi:pimeloyl-ACP methyl ester carboxylesterase